MTQHNHRQAWVGQVLAALEADQSLQQFAEQIKGFRKVELTKACRTWTAREVRAWCAYNGVLPGDISDQSEHRLSRVVSAYHNFFAVRPFSRDTWKDIKRHRGTDKPYVPAYLSAPLRPDLRIALARFRLCASTLGVVQGRLQGIRYADRKCGLTGGAACAAGVQDELHAIFNCEYGEIRELRSRFSVLFQFLPPEHPQAMRLFINQQNFAGVADFVLQLQTIIQGANQT